METLNNVQYTLSEKYERIVYKDFGVCGNCAYFKYRKTKLMNEEAWCDRSYKKNRITPNTVDPIISCSDYYPKGQLTLLDMSNIATLIDIKENITGFRLNDKEVIITPQQTEKN